MKNKPILSYSLWLSVAFLSVVYFMTQDKTREIEAISETTHFTKKMGTELLKKIESEMDYFNLDMGKNGRLHIILNKVKHHHFLLDSIYLNGRLDWKELEVTFDSLPAWANRYRDSSSLNYKNYSSKQVEIIHQDFLYRTYQKFLMDEKHKFPAFHSSSDVFIESLDFTFYLNMASHNILTYSDIYFSLRSDDEKKHTNSFNFNESDSIIFEVVTDFYRIVDERGIEKEGKKITKKYKIIARDKKGIKINSFFDYEEIE